MYLRGRYGIWWWDGRRINLRFCVWGWKLSPYPRWTFYDRNGKFRRAKYQWILVLYYNGKSRVIGLYTCLFREGCEREGTYIVIGKVWRVWSYKWIAGKRKSWDIQLRWNPPRKLKRKYKHRLNWNRNNGRPNVRASFKWRL